MQKLLVVSHIVWVYVGGPQNFGDAGAPPLWDQGMNDRLQKRSCARMILGQI